VSSTNANRYFDEILEIESLYQAEGVFYQPFWEFMYKFDSMYRYWVLTRKYIDVHDSKLKNTQFDGSAEMLDIYSDTVGVDSEQFPVFVRMSTLSLALAIVENFLGAVTEEITNDFNVKYNNKKRSGPYINGCVSWMSELPGFNINIEPYLWRDIDAMRKVRNIFIHRLDQDIPEALQATMREMLGSNNSSQQAVTNEFVDMSLKSVAKFVKSIELAYIAFNSKSCRS